MPQRKSDSASSIDKIETKRIRATSSPTNEADTSQNLNDDCLRKIFSFLSDLDLCSVGESSHRFRALAQRQFHTKYRGKSFEILNSPILFSSLPAELSTREYAKILHHFKKLVNNVTINSNPFYCDRKMEICFAVVFEQCKNLRSLTLRGHMPFNVFDLPVPWGNYFPHLRTLNIRFSDYEVSEHFLLQIIGVCPKLKQLTIDNLDYFREKIMRQIGKYLKHVEEIKIVAGMISDTFAKKTSLPKLRKLNIMQLKNDDLYSKSSLQLLQSLAINSVQIESLAIDYGLCDAHFRQILIKFTNLKSITLHAARSIEANFFNQLAENLKQVEHFGISLKIDEQIEQHIFAIVENFSALKTLHLNDDFLRRMCDMVFEDLVNIRKQSNDKIPLNIRFDCERGRLVRVNPKIEKQFKQTIRLNFVDKNN